MISDAYISRLDELVGDYNTPFFTYLIYSYGLPLEECEAVIERLKEDILENKIMPDNMVLALERYFRARVSEVEKEAKIEYLRDLLNPDGEFFIRHLSAYGLSGDEIEVVFNRIKSKILEDNISEFEIKRDLEYYFENTVRQVRYINDLNRIKGRNFDTIIIRNAKRKYPILQNRDILDIFAQIREEIIDAKEFKKGIEAEFKTLCLKKSEAKKAEGRMRLNVLVEGKGDSFNTLIRVKGLTKSDGKAIVSEILDDINSGKIQPESVDGTFLTKRFNEYGK